MDKLTLRIDGYGEVTVTTAALDAAMSRYLPSSPLALRTLCEERSGIDCLSHITEVSSFVIMLADWDHNTDGDPLSADGTTCPKCGGDRFRQRDTKLWIHYGTMSQRCPK